MKKTIKSESGRSMVEMLGVLAVIGVLSVGGIYGYRYAMVQMTANKMAELTQRFILAFETEKQKEETIWDVWDEDGNLVGCVRDDDCIQDITTQFCALYAEGFCQKATPQNAYHGFYGPAYKFGSGNVGFSTIPRDGTTFIFSLFIDTSMNVEICQAYLRLLGGMELPEEFVRINFDYMLQSFSEADIYTYCTHKNTAGGSSRWRKIWMWFSNY